MASGDRKPEGESIWTGPGCIRLARSWLWRSSPACLPFTSSKTSHRTFEVFGPRQHADAPRLSMPRSFYFCGDDRDYTGRGCPIYRHQELGLDRIFTTLGRKKFRSLEVRRGSWREISECLDRSADTNVHRSGQCGLWLLR
jgi:hypothetical protein